MPRVERLQHTIQDALPQESLIAVRLAQGATDIEDLRQKLAAALPQNSEGTRLRYVDSLIKWFFRDGINGLASSVWTKYQSPDIQAAIHRYLYLSAEPIMAKSVSAVLSRLSEGVLVPAIISPGRPPKLSVTTLHRKRKRGCWRTFGRSDFWKELAAGTGSWGRPSAKQP